MTNTQRGMAIAVGSAVVMGLYPAATRGVYAAGGNAMVTMLATIWARGLTLGIYCAVRRQRIFDTGPMRRMAFTSGLFQALTTIAIIGALKFIPGPMVIIIMFIHTLMLLIFTTWRGETKLDFWTVLTTLTALFGLTMVVDLWHVQGHAEWIGIGLALLGALATANRLYVFGQQTKTRSPARVGAEAFLMASLMLTALALFKPPHLPHGAIGYIYLALASASLSIGNIGMLYGIALIGAFRYSLLRKLEPVFAALFSFLLLDEVLKPPQYLGMGIVIISLVTYQITTHRKARQAAQEAIEIAQ